MRSTIHVLKMGGNELAGPDWLAQFAQTVAELPGRKIIVHGGGRMIAELQSRLGIPPQMVDGLRVTDAETLDVAQMVMSGRVNKMLVAALLNAGVQALGLSGVDGGLLHCRKKSHPDVDLGLVGEIEGVRITLLNLLMNAGWTPVISPISLGPAGQAYNVNADEAAVDIAAAMVAAMALSDAVSLPAGSLNFITNMPGVLDENQEVVRELTLAKAKRLFQAGFIQGGMIPKVEAAFQALNRSVAEVRIVDLAGLREQGGTYCYAG